MRVLLVHNFYQQPGGEDAVFRAEGGLLERYGHEVFRYTAHNDRLDAMGSISMGATMLWNRQAHGELLDLIRRVKPEIVHVHNTFPLLSPSVYYAAHGEGVPIVQTLHNYRLMCVTAQLFRDGQVCEDCLGKVPWRGVVHACYRDSHLASGGAAMMLTAHRFAGTWRQLISRYIALTEFARGKFIEAGLPPERIVVKPNFMDFDPGVGSGNGGFALYVGRLSAEKGVQTLLTAWERLHGRLPIKIVGDGPLASRVADYARRYEGIEWLGQRSREEVLGLMRDACVLVFPSACYEGFPVVIAEAFAVGLPVLASGFGSMSTIVEHGRTGFHFTPGDPIDLVDKIERILSDPAEWHAMRDAARGEFLNEYGAEQNHRALMRIYEEASRNRVETAVPTG